jgi:dipeptidyl aminopeptidase/acylaminoacyl peptidase
MPAHEKRRITAEDLYRFQLVSDPQISPDGRHVVFCQQRVDQKTEKKYTNLWLAPTEGGQPRQFTYGDHADTHPRWSPNGDEIAFLSNRKDEKQAQIYLVPFHGGEARPLTNLKGSFSGFAYSPDGRRLVTQFRHKDQAAIEREEDEQKKKLGVVCRHITRVTYKEDGAGYLPQERWHIWTIDVTSGEAKQLTAGHYDETEPRWSPDGRHILFVSNRSEDPDFNLDETELYLVPAEGGDMRQLKAHHGRKFAPSFAPDGQWVAYLGREMPGKWWQNTCLYVTPVNSGQESGGQESRGQEYGGQTSGGQESGGQTSAGETRNLTLDYDWHVSSATLNDIGGSPPLTPPTWAPDSQKIYFQVTRHADQPLMALSISEESATVETVVAGPGVVGAFTFDKTQANLAYFYGDMADPGQVWLRPMATGEGRPLTQVNHELLSELDLGHIEEVWFKGPEGNELQGWILTPPGFDPHKQYPSILEIHGGPQLQYGRFFMHEFYYLAAHDYVVYWSNPRGSQGYGNEHAGAIYNRWGTVDFADVMAWTDYVAQKPYIDKARMGVTGGSYGGYMTSLIIGRTQRFQAAVAQRVVSNFISFYGSSDMNWGAEYLFGMEKAPWEALEDYWNGSPIKYIGRAQTPTLIFHSEQDLRCGQEQGEQLFVALKRLGVDTELVLFPEESHGLSRGGRTDRRIARLQHMQRWFDNYLKD